MLLGTRMTNNEPSAIKDLDVVARYDATDPNYVIKDSSNRISALLDKSKRLQTSTILDSGNLTINKVYIIVATTLDYFGTGRIVGNMFVAATALALSANNSVREVLGNHITQTDTAKMPIHTYDVDTKEWFALFDGVNDYLKSLPFTLNQPTSIYGCLKQNSWANGRCIFSGDTLISVLLQQSSSSPSLKLYKAGELSINNNLNIGIYGNLYALANSENSSIKINNTPSVLMNIDNINMGGFILGSGQAIGTSYNSNISVKEIVIKRIATDESDTIFNYFKNKHKVQY
jgi:hypothetical protein